MGPGDLSHPCVGSLGPACLSWCGRGRGEPGLQPDLPELPSAALHFSFLLSISTRLTVKSEGELWAGSIFTSSKSCFKDK